MPSRQHDQLNASFVEERRAYGNQPRQLSARQPWQKPGSRSLSVPAFKIKNRLPRRCAASSMSAIWSWPMFGLLSTAIVVTVGTNSCNKPQALRPEISADIHYPGHVAARPVEARDQPRPDRITAGIEDDGNCCGRRLGCGCGNHRRIGDNHGHAVAHQIGDQRRKSVVLVLRPTMLDGDVAALDKAGFVQALEKTTQIFWELAGCSAMKIPDHRQRLLLRPRRERPRRRAPRRPKMNFRRCMCHPLERLCGAAYRGRGSMGTGRRAAT